MTTRAQQAPAKKEYVIPLNESRAKEWVKSLPIADVGETTRRLYHGLLDLNRRVLPPVSRIRISEMLRPAVEMTSMHLQKRLSYRAFPLPSRGMKIFNLNYALLQEFAGSYQLAAVDMLTRHELSKRPMQVAIYRAIDYMGRTLLSSYAVYSRTRESIWSDIHQLYLAASENELADVGFKDSKNRIRSIDERYIEINLLALTKPYSLRQEEVFKVARFFEGHLKSVSISHEPKERVGEYVHVAVLTNDEPAVLMPYSDLPHSPTVRVFNIKPLINTLEKFVQATGDDPAASVMTQSGLNRNLAQRLVTHLTTVRNRSFNRFPKKEKITMVTQLPNILEAITSAGSAKNVDQMREEDVLFNSMLFGNDVVMSEHHEAEQEPEEENTVGLNIWQMLNSSVGGYGLLWAHHEVSGARVGELVGLRDTTQEGNPWMIGVVKWMESTKDIPLRCGVELLSSKAVPLTVLDVIGRGISQELPMDGLMLPSVEGIRPDPVVILSAYIFQPNDEILVRMHDREERIQLTVLDECLGAFSYFRFTKEEADLKEESSDDFDTIWDAI